MWGKTGRGVVGMLALALAATGLGTTAGAEEEVDESTYYIIDAYGHPVEPYSELPNEVQNGAPSTVVELQAAPLPVHCEAIAALYDPSTLVDGLITIISEGRYKNPGKAWAHNPEDSLPSKAQVSTFPNGPEAYAECPSPTDGIAKATYGRYLSKEFSLESASTDTTMKKLPGERVVVAETTNKFIGIKVGELSIASVFSWLKVEFSPSAEPTVSYRLELLGISDGKAPSGAGKDGILLSGQSLGGNDWIKQFNAGAKSYEGALEVLARYGFSILEPRFTKNQRSAADRGGSIYPYFFELTALNGKLQPSARKNQTGHGFGMRLGVSRIGGDYAFFEK